MNAFEVLGLSLNADEAQVRAAYRTEVKRWHPDQFQDQARQDQAQEQLIRLNLAYEEALRITAQRQVAFNTVSIGDAIRMARRLLDQGHPETALRQLLRAESKDAGWYFAQGDILMRMRQYGSAHQSYREAVRREPENLAFRRAAFEAARQVKKHARPLRRAADAIGGLFRRK